MGLSSCGPLPKPFQHKSSDTNPLLDVRDGYGVHVTLLASTLVPMGGRLAGAVAEALGRRNIPASANPEMAPSRYALRGVVVRSSGGAANYHLNIHWQLYEPGGPDPQEPLGSYQQKVENRWWRGQQGGDPRLIAEIGDEVARPVAALLQDADDTVRPVAATGPGPAGLLVPAVTGAPGDGNKSLTIAIRQAMRGVDILVTEDPRQAARQLQGQVEVGEASEGRQTVRVTWIVGNAEGREIGRAVQKNVIKAGSLDARWGQTAAMIAAAALPGIQAVLGRAGGVLAPGRQPPMPAPRPLLSHPGRAGPPPQ